MVDVVVMRRGLLWAVPAVPTVAAGVLLAPAATWIPSLRRRAARSLSGLGDQSHVALTFDDGPDPDRTPGMLEVLDRIGVRATFFVVARRVAEAPSLVRRMVDAGHEIAVHGYDHRPPVRPWRDTADLRRAVQIVAAEAGHRPLWYRPPYGVLTLTRWRAAVRMGLRPVLWSAWGRDWFAGASAESILSTIERDLGAGGTVLLHDCSPNSAQTALAVPAVVELCRARGWGVGPLREHGIAPCPWPRTAVRRQT